MRHCLSDLACPDSSGTPRSARRRDQAGEMALGLSGLGQVPAPDGQRTLLPEARALLVTGVVEIGADGSDAGPCAACGRGLAGQPGPPVRVCRWVFPGTADSVRQARSALAAALGDYASSDEAILCVSELATNAILHSASGWPGGTFTVRVEIRPGSSVHLEVHDEGGPWQSGQDADGRMHGLGIVAGLAEGFSVRTGSGGRIVRAFFGWPDAPGGQR